MKLFDMTDQELTLIRKYPLIAELKDANKSGIYCAVFKDGYYIGKSTNVFHREASHRTNGADDFYILMYLDYVQLGHWESIFIDALKHKETLVNRLYATKHLNTSENQERLALTIWDRFKSNKALFNA